MKKKLITTFAVLALLYLTFSAAEFTFNPINWHTYTRLFYLLCVFYTGLEFLGEKLKQ